VPTSNERTALQSREGTKKVNKRRQSDDLQSEDGGKAANMRPTIFKSSDVKLKTGYEDKIAHF